jgi:hypothetical protein
MQNISSSRIAPVTPVNKSLSSPPVTQSLPVQGTNNLTGFLPPYAEPQKNAVPNSVALTPSTIDSVHDRAVPQDTAEKTLNERKSSLAVYYVWKNKTDSGVTDNVANIPVDATYKRFRATW